MSTIARITARRKALGLSEREVSRRAGLNESFLKDWRLHPSRRPRQDTLERLAPALNWTVGQMLAEADAVADSGRAAYEVDTPAGGLPVAAAKRDAREASRVGGAFLMVPEYDVRAAAGGGTIPEREEVRSLWPFSRSTMNALRLDGRDLAIVEVVGDSMAPTLISGDKVMVDLADHRVGVPGLFAIWDGDGLVVKRVERMWARPESPQRLKLISDNTAHTPYEVDLQWVHIVGRVVLLVRRL
ncbi:MAG: LexA family transcriptional regulator [Hyphomonadaceae bacterium]|nr:LexA family transcriptional regulator [Hyphomonadaceae bacterium]